MIKRYLNIILAVAVSAIIANAEISLPSVIGDNMVLQQQSAANIWGKATPGAKVSVTPSWSNQSVTTKANADGSWLVSVATPAATAEPQTIKITDGRDTHELANILIGEVWYCSGQSNMEMPVRGFRHQPVKGSLDTIVKARPSKPIRMFTVEKAVSSTPLDDCVGHWGVNSPAEVAECSATAYFFADYLNSVLDVPIGLVIADWGGTNVQPWMTREVAAEAGLDVSCLDRPVDRSTPDVLLMPSVLHNAMAAPVIPFTVKGMLWYQGENNCYNPEEYEQLMPYFVKGMRESFGNPDMPFYYCQIAPFGDYGNVEKNVPKLRIAQAHLMEQVPHTGMVVTLDIGDSITIHPSNKPEVGRRLALWALAKDYGKNDFTYSGPIFDRMESQGNRALIYFTNTGGAVAPFGRDLDGFEAAGSDGVYHPAHANVELRAGTLVLYCDEVDEIKSVRYGHRAMFEATLFDNFGLPASPFVTSGKLE